MNIAMACLCLHKVPKLISSRKFFRTYKLPNIKYSFIFAGKAYLLKILNKHLPNNVEITFRKGRLKLFQVRICMNTYM